MPVDLEPAIRDQVALRVSPADGPYTLTMLEVHVGQSVRLTATARDAAGERADPTAVRLIYRKPSEQESTTLAYPADGAIVREEVGRFHLDLTPDEPGLWRCRVETDGPVEGAAEGSFNVEPPAV